MLKKIENRNMGKSDIGWLKSSFHFSFSEYYNPANIHFGNLRVINDDLIEAKTGFPMHPHEDMEIVTYIIDGKLTHKDSMGNIGELSRGEAQYMSSGTGVYHSEYNLGDENLRLLQIWIYPDKKDYKPNYGEHKFNWSDRENKWLHMVSSNEGSADIKIHQDVNIYSLYLDKGNEEFLEVNKDRQAYLVQIEGVATINEIELKGKDAMEIVEEDIRIIAKEDSHFLVLEMKK